MDDLKSVMAGRAADLSTKRKEAKEKTQITTGIWQMEDTPANEESQQRYSGLAEGKLHKPNGKARMQAQARDIAIDRMLEELLRRGWLDPKFRVWHAKCAHVLGLDRYNQIAISCADADKPARLLSYKLKGAMIEHQRLLQHQEY